MALDAGCAAATILPLGRISGDEKAQQLRIAFDGDAVLFSDEAEQVFRRHGLDVFNATESAAAHEPLRGGPFKDFLVALHAIQGLFPAEDSPLRTALITARGAPSHERVIRTLRAWGIRIDESLFLGGLDKVPFLKAFDADFFFDDQRMHCDSASALVATGHVPHGVSNES
jgi:5'-nucleotidase